MKEDIDELDSDKVFPILSDLNALYESKYYGRINYRAVNEGYNNTGILVYSDKISQEKLNTIFPKFTDPINKTHRIQEICDETDSQSVKMLRWRNNWSEQEEVNLLRKRLDSKKIFLDLLLIEEQK